MLTTTTVKKQTSPKARLFLCLVLTLCKLVEGVEKVLF